MNRKIPGGSIAIKAAAASIRTCGSSAVRSAAAAGRTEEVASLLARGADFHKPDHGGFSALHLAASGGHGEVVQLLLANGADFQTKAKDFTTPLSCAASNGSAEVVQLLLDEGADVNSKMMDDETPLHGAAEEGHVKVVQVKPKTHNPHWNQSETRHRVAPKLTGVYKQTLNAAAGVRQVLLANGADVRAKTRDGETPEDCAVAGGHAKVVALLRVSGGATQEREAVWQTGGLGRVS